MAKKRTSVKGAFTGAKGAHIVGGIVLAAAAREMVKRAQTPERNSTNAGGECHAPGFFQED